MILAIDSPSLAHDCATAVHEVCRLHNARKSSASAKRWFRIGMATGVVVSDPSGGAKNMAGFAITRAVRLESQSGIGEILIDTSTYDALSSAQKARYGAQEQITGKRNEMFPARRCIVVADLSIATVLLRGYPGCATMAYFCLTKYFIEGSDMETTKLSSKGQVILPAALRAAKEWHAGVEFAVEATADGVLLRPFKPGAATTLDEVVGCAGYTGKAHSVADMDAAISAEIKSRHARG